MNTVSEDALARIDEHWNRTHWIGRGMGGGPEGGGPVPADRILGLVDRPGLHWPYLTLVRSSSQPALKDFTSALPGYRQRSIDAERTRGLIAAGYTVKFQRLEDFDDGLRGDVAALQTRFGLVTTAYAFVTPAESAGLSFHRDASHVVVVQLEGRKVWNIVRPAGGANPHAGLEPDPQGERVEFVLSPGDVMYLPHGWPHCARTDSGRSTHITFTLARPFPHALAAGILAGGGGGVGLGGARDGDGDGGLSPMSAEVDRFGL